MSIIVNLSPTSLKSLSTKYPFRGNSKRNGQQTLFLRIITCFLLRYCWFFEQPSDVTRHQCQNGQQMQYANGSHLPMSGDAADEARRIKGIFGHFEVNVQGKYYAWVQPLCSKNVLTGAALFAIIAFRIKADPYLCQNNLLRHFKGKKDY